MTTVPEVEEIDDEAQLKRMNEFIEKHKHKHPEIVKELEKVEESTSPIPKEEQKGEELLVPAEIPKPPIIEPAVPKEGQYEDIMDISKF